MKLQAVSGFRPLPKLPSSQPASPAPTPPNNTQEAPEPPENTREVRISRFVRGVTRESLEHLRFLSSMWGFAMVGATVGTLAFTPIGINLANENAAVVGGFGIGGGVLGMGLGATAGYLLEKRRADGKGEATPHSRLTDTGLVLASTLNALPRFVYPTVVGATAEQQAVIYDALDRLPLKDATAASVAQVIPNLVDTGISGMAQPALTHTRLLFDQSYLDNPTQGPRLVLHENGHAVDYKGGFGLVGSHNWSGPFGHGPHVSDYAKTNRYEDWAESYEHFHSEREHFQAEFADKAAAVERASFPNPVERLVDQPAVRELGKQIGSGLGQVPYARTILETSLSLVAPLQLHRGADALERGLAENDPALKLAGKMNLIGGILMAVPGGAPLAAMANVASLGMQLKAGGDSEALEKANQQANQIMTFATGPLGIAAAAAGKQLAKAGINLDASANMIEDAPPTTSTLKGLISTVGGMVGGSALGVAVGSALGGAAGASMGAFWGGLGGGILGLGVYGAARAGKKEELDPSPYDLTLGDKVFLTKIVGGALAGSAAGTVAGAFGGSSLGSTLGVLAFGPSAAGWAGNLGGWVGALAGAYVVGQGGAWAGRKLTETHPSV